MTVKTNEDYLPKENGDTGILDYLMRRFGGRVLKLAYYYVRDRYLAEDIMQEVFFRVYKNLDKFRKDSSYYTWIYRITVNLCNDYKESGWYKRILLGHEGRKDWDTTDTRTIEEVEGGEIFRKVMDLPLKYRTVAALYYFEDIPTPEIARILKISENAVRTRLFRGRNLLKEALGGNSE